MDLTPQQAQASLRDAQAASARLRHALAAGGASGYLILWGLVWMFAFAVNQFAPRQAGWIWLGSDLVGAAGSMWIGIQTGRRGPVRHADGRRIGWRIFASWFVLSLYVVIGFVLLPPTNGKQIAAVIAAIAMFAYVLMGLWLECGFLIALGLGVTALIVVAYLFVNEWFDLLMSLGGGGALLVTGLYVRQRWSAGGGSALGAPGDTGDAAATGGES